MLATHVAKSDVVITTALIPGRTAPILVTAEMVAGMQAGSVIVDLAAEQGGNCELTEPGERIVREHGVTIIGERTSRADVASTRARCTRATWRSSSSHRSRTASSKIDLDDEITKGCVITHEGEIVHARRAEALASQGGHR